MPAKERIPIAPERNPDDSVREKRLDSIDFKNAFELMNPKFILMKKHEPQIVKLPKVGKCFKIIFGEI